jgi:hypothetical protein
MELVRPQGFESELIPFMIKVTEDWKSRGPSAAVGRPGLPLSYSHVIKMNIYIDRLCGLVIRRSRVRLLGTTRKKSSGSGTGSTQPREYN